MNTADILIRKMTIGDIDQVHDLELRSFPTPWPKKSFLYELGENKAAYLWVAESREESDKKKIIGMTVAWLMVDEAHIATIAVDKDHQRRGIASRLIFTALTELANKGAILATLEVRESNQAAHTLYQQFGFQAVGRRKAYYRDNHEDAILMTLDRINTDQLTAINRIRV